MSALVDEEDAVDDVSELALPVGLSDDKKIQFLLKKVKPFSYATGHPQAWIDLFEFWVELISDSETQLVRNFVTFMNALLIGDEDKLWFYANKDDFLKLEITDIKETFTEHFSKKLSEFLEIACTKKYDATASSLSDYFMEKQSNLRFMDPKISDYMANSLCVAGLEGEFRSQFLKNLHLTQSEFIFSARGYESRIDKPTSQSNPDAPVTMQQFNLFQQKMNQMISLMINPNCLNPPTFFLPSVTAPAPVITPTSVNNSNSTSNQSTVAPPNSNTNLNKQ